MRRFVTIISIMVFAGVLSLSCSEKHEVQGSAVEYKAGDMTFKGYLAYDALKQGRRPGVLVVHEWWGYNDHVRRRADMLAELGYTALAVDMYGGGKQANNSEEAAALAMEVSENRDIRNERFMAAVNFLKQQESVDPERIAAIGYSFGGNVVLQSALEGADLKGAVSFHGGVILKMPSGPVTVKAKMLLLKGEKDWYITPQMLVQFKNDMKKIKADYKIISYKDAEHGYSNPESAALAEKFKGMHIKYNEEADKKSWADMQEFLRVVFRKF